MKNNKTMDKVVMVACKVLEVLFWIADIFMAMMGIASLAFKDMMYNLVMNAVDDGSITIQGISYELSAFTDVSQGRIAAAFFVIFITGAISLSLLAMVFRNIYLIFKTTEGKTKYAQGATPFQPENVRMIREIGIFTICISVIELIASIIVNIITSTAGEVSVNLSYVIFGFVILCLSRYFSYGVELENDVDGLL